jgi:outer membrane protein OmpA-like peptidoglycan-associated protein
VRTLASLEWFPAIPPSDRDKDGIIDDLDACPDVPGEPNDDPAKNGCPPSDRDGDGIFDDDDACPDEPGPANADPEKNGCPLRDRDGDTILDDDDACPDEPGPPNADPKKHGCPPRDRDGDTIFDDDDACPDEPGPPNADPARNGCPLARIEASQIVIYERVEFEFDKAVLRPESDAILNAVKDILDAHPEFTRISIEGHTDSEGTEKYNQNLSEERAAAVVEWMVNHGIDRNRVTSRGFGELRPIDTNETAAGRQNNRRVEFHILEKNGEPVPRVDPLLYKEKALQDEKSAAKAPAPKPPARKEPAPKEPATNQ